MLYLNNNPKYSPTHFMPKLNTKKFQQKVSRNPARLQKFSNKIAQSEESPKGAKFRPIWSP
jgi:hypothetical protein